MEHIRTHCRRFILNNRWQFDSGQGGLSDLEFRREAVQLAPVVSRTLAILARSPYVVLGRRRLLDDGWRTRGLEVCDNSLNQAICALRQMFGALPPGRPYIKTIPRIGYCLLADVRVMVGYGTVLNASGPGMNAEAAEPLLECLA